MKRVREEVCNEFNINNKKSLADLQKRAKFTYVNMYQGKEGKKYHGVLKHPKFQKFLQKLNSQPLEVAEIAILGKNGFGVLATENIQIKKGGRDRTLGVYWGKLVHEGKEDSPYIFTISKNEIDARKYGNWTRFVNHSKGNYNVVAKQKTFVSGKIRFSYIEYALIKSVKAGQQLLVDYGPNYEFDKKHQIFLNPSNGLLHSRELYVKHKEVYAPLTTSLAAVYRELIPDAMGLFGPVLFTQMLSGAIIQSAKNKNAFSAELPILRADKRGNILDDRKQSGITTLMLAAYIGNEKAVHALIKSCGANIEQQNTMDGHTSLFYAIKSKCSPIKKDRIVKMLIDADIQLSTQDKEGHTALHWCVEFGNLRLLKLIFSDRKSKANALEALDVQDRECLDPLAYALAKGQLEIAAYLMGIFKNRYKISYFHKRHNEWLLPVIKLILAEHNQNSLPPLMKLLMKNEFHNNAAAMLVLSRSLKQNGLTLNLK